MFTKNLECKENLETLENYTWNINFLKSLLVAQNRVQMLCKRNWRLNWVFIWETQGCVPYLKTPITVPGTS